MQITLKFKFSVSSSLVGYAVRTFSIDFKDYLLRYAQRTLLSRLFSSTMAIQYRNNIATANLFFLAG